MAAIVNERDLKLLSSTPRIQLNTANITVVLSNPVVVVAADSLGVPTSYTNTGTTITVFKSGQPLAYGTIPGTYSVTSYSTYPANSATTGISGGSIESVNKYVINDLTYMSSTTDTVVLTYTISVKDFDTAGTAYTFYATQTINKVKNGSTGTSGRTVSLIASTQSFTYTSSGITPSPPTATITATALNTVGTVYYDFLVDSVSVQNTTSNIYTYTPTALYTSMPQQILVKIRETANTGNVVASNTTPMIATKPDPAQRSTTINAFAWGMSKPASTGAITYTWATGAVSAYPAGWTASAPASTVTGQTLYMISLTIADSTGTAATTVTDWSNSTSNTIGYRQDGSIGPQGSSARRAYYVTTSGAPPATPANTADVAPIGWSTTATSSLSDGYYMYQSDGLLSATTATVTWGPPYLSNLKVGSLSAISANMGTVTIGVLGSLASSGKGYGYGDGFFLGYSDGYKFDVGNSTNFMRLNGTNLVIQGNITGASSIDITGNAIFGGSGMSGWSGLGTVGVLANYNGQAFFGVMSQGFQPSGSAGAFFGGFGSSGVFATSMAAVGWGIVTSNTNGGNGENGGAIFCSGAAKFTDIIKSSVATGTAPIQVSSTTMCTNLTAYQASRVYNSGAQTGIYLDGSAAVLQPDHNFVVVVNGSPYWSSMGGAQSDIRLKNLTNDIVEGLSTINKLSVVNFTWKNQESYIKKGVITGLIAQEVEKVIPTAVTIIEDTYLLDKTDIIPFLVKAVQELHAKVTELETQIGMKNG